jgi:hypothetical protein
MYLFANNVVMSDLPQLTTGMPVAQELEPAGIRPVAFSQEIEKNGKTDWN